MASTIIADTYWRIIQYPDVWGTYGELCGRFAYGTNHIYQAESIYPGYNIYNYLEYRALDDSWIRAYTPYTWVDTSYRYFYVQYVLSDEEANKLQTWLNANADRRWTLSFNANGHGTAPSSQYVYEGDLPTKPTDPTATGWVFSGWYKDSACTNPWMWSAEILTHDTTLYAKWVEVVKAYVGISDIAHRMPKAYVGIDNTARQIVKGYVGIEGVAHRIF